MFLQHGEFPVEYEPLSTEFHSNGAQPIEFDESDESYGNES